MSSPENWQEQMEWAAEHDAANTVAALLDEGVDPSATDRTGISFLSMAVLYGSSKVAELLIQRGADVNAPDPRYGTPPLLLATHRQDPLMVRMLLDNGANPSVRDQDDKTASYYPNGEDVLGNDLIKSMLNKATEDRQKTIVHAFLKLPLP